MGKKFAEYSKFDLSEINKEVLKKWDENQVFAKSMTEREGCPSFVFFEGPPSANGMPGIHHVMARSIKDIFCRYKTMKGFQVKRKAGWDTHGLPVELGVEKALGITKEDIGKTISVAEYNAACRKDVMKFTKEWEDLTHKMGYWVGIILSILIATVMGGAFYVFGPQILSVYNKEPDVIKSGMEILSFTTLTYFLCGIMDLFPGAMRGMGRSGVPMILSIIGTVGTRIFWIYVVFPRNRALDVLFISYPVSWGLTIAMQVCCFILVRRKVHREIQ